MGKKGKILLLTPNLKGVKDGCNRIQPPLGPMISAAIMKEQGHEVKIYDAALEGWENKIEIDKKTVLVGQSDEEIASIVSNYSPDVIGISALFSNLMDSAHNIARISKNVNPKIPVILGGNHISNAISDYKFAFLDSKSGLPRYLKDLEDKNIDYAMRGEVDFAFPELVDGLLNERDISRIPGLVKRKGDLEYLVNDPPEKINNLSDMPHPARDLVNMEGYFNIGSFHSAKSKSPRVLSVMASRGCPEKCTFCTTPEMWGATVRWRDTGNIIKEITDAKEKYNIGEIQFEDDTITSKRTKLLDLCSELEKVGLPWCTPNGTKANYHSKNQLNMYKAMANSGCYQITLACESGVQRVLDQVIKKNLKVDEMKPAIEKAKEAGMFVHTFWISGYPGETREEMEETYKIMKEVEADSYSLAILSPLPGTPTYRQVVRENLWWPGRGIGDMLYRTSLVKVDGYNSPEEFEEDITRKNIEANDWLKQRDPERFERKYGNDQGIRNLVKQT